ncbi:unnamed protein product [Orchesella dallaii]|uniref:Major facilitator superfamily (MFS) profile domain-containing protein n=1 Tax=Orchesella dallaii TaxID=48710 RepID=A0ABP1QZN7_9HEXA
MHSQDDLNYLAGQIGEFGKYQLFQHVLHCLVWLLAGVNVFSFVFVFPVIEHRCYVSEIDDEWSPNSELSTYIPTLEEEKLSSCEKYRNPGTNNSTISCGEHGYMYIYNSSYYGSSRITELDMVCEREWMRTLLQSIFLFGALVGAAGGGALADKFGRKPVLFYSGVLSFFWGFGSTFLDNFYLCTFCMMMYGVFGAGAGSVPAVTLSMELVGPSIRSYCGAAITFAFACGGVIVVGLAYFISWNASLLQLIYVTLSLSLFGNWWLVDESICWLWEQRRYEEAIQLLEKAAKINGIKLSFPEGFDQHSTVKSTQTEVQPQSQAKQQPANKASILDVFRTPEIRKRTLVMMCSWFAAAVLFFGLSFNSVNMFGNPYVVFLIVCVAEFPAHPISIFLMPKFGYKLMLVGNLLFSGTACVILAFLPSDIVSTTLAMVAKLSATMIYNIVNAYTSELFPTVIRNTTLGLCIMGARFGGCVIPLINMLTVFSGKLPEFIFGGTAIITSVAVLFFLPETMNKPIPQTIEDVENQRKQARKNDEVENGGISNVGYVHEG